MRLAGLARWLVSSVFFVGTGIRRRLRGLVGGEPQGHLIKFDLTSDKIDERDHRNVVFYTDGLT